MDNDYKVWIGIYATSAILFLGNYAKIEASEINPDLRNDRLRLGCLETKAVINQREDLIPKRNKASKFKPDYFF